MKPVKVRRELADALKLDLVGPNERLGTSNEVLSQAPSRWYLTGFLVPLDADQSLLGVRPILGVNLGTKWLRGVRPGTESCYTGS